MNDEKLHEITYTARLTRSEIEGIVGHDGGHEQGLIDACREWLANNPQGLTREEFDALPDGSVVKVRDVEYIMFNGCVWWRTIGGNVRSAVLEDEDIRDMTVVSTPPAPTLDDAQFVLTDDGVWYRVDLDDWACRNSKLTTAELRGIYPTAVILLPGPQIGGEA